jgi:hypothetical protein
VEQSILTAGSADRGNAALQDDASRFFTPAAGVRRRSDSDQHRGDNLRLASNALLLPGLGCASVSKNGETVIELQGIAGEHATTVAEVERLALAEPEQEWCIHMVSLLDDRHYRREGAGLWKLYARGYGLS